MTISVYVADDNLLVRWCVGAFGLGIGLSTGPVAAALGPVERIEHPVVVGDTVNLRQRLQEWDEPCEPVLSESVFASLTVPPDCVHEPAILGGPEAPVAIHRLRRRRI